MPGRGGHLSMLFGVPVARAFAACFGGLLELVSRWSKQEGFGHAFCIPRISLWRLWQRRLARVCVWLYRVYRRMFRIDCLGLNLNDVAFA